VVFNDHFTTVSFVEKIEFPTHWAQLVKKSCEKDTAEHYELAKTWLFPDAEPGDILLPQRNPNVSNNSSETLIDQETISNDVSQNLLSTRIQPPIHVGLSSDSDAIRISQNNDYIQCPLLPSVLSSRNGEITTSQDEDSLSIHCLINLEITGLQQSPRIAVH
jgi:hypothetical protein